MPTLKPSRQPLSIMPKMYECNICCETVPLSETISCTNGHKFCNSCLQNSAKEAIFGEGKPILTCLEINCKCCFSRRTLTTVLDAELMEKLEERLQFEDINTANIANLVRCKFCKYAAILDVPAEIDFIFICENVKCGKRFCRLCDIDWEQHVGLKCQDIKMNKEMKLRKNIEEKMAEAIIRQCHKCKAKIIKESGCNKMTCRCGATLCYLCRTPNVEYAHFCNHKRTVDKKCPQCNNSCGLWDDATKTVDEPKIDEIQREGRQAQTVSSIILDNADKIAISFETVKKYNETEEMQSEMSEKMQEAAIDCAIRAMEKYKVQYDIAKYIKEEFDKKYNYKWHCIVGQHFASYVSFIPNHYIYFNLANEYILLFKAN